MGLRTLDTAEVPNLKADDWVLIIDGVNGFAYSPHGNWRVKYGDAKPDSKEMGANMGINTQAMNPKGSKMWARMDTVNSRWRWKLIVNIEE